MNNIFFSNYSIKFASYVLLQALGVYVNLYYLIPRFLKPGKYPLYITLFLSTILLVSFGITGGYFLNAYVTGIPFETLFYVKPGEYIQLWKSGPLSSTVASMTLAMSIKLTKNWIAAEKHRTTVEKEKLETELKFLRSQLNPHFLFNTINSIFVLIHKNQDLASDSLAKFSELLRYQLYHCNEPM
ncbi:MAG: histidine kinase, partial [Bacteroidota bacterium]